MRIDPERIHRYQLTWLKELPLTNVVYHPTAQAHVLLREDFKYYTSYENFPLETTTGTWHYQTNMENPQAKYV